MSKRLLPLLLLLSLCLLGLPQLQTGHASPYTDIDVDTAYNMITSGLYPNLVVLDVRNQSEYDSGHIYGAVWVPVLELETRIGELAGHENHEIIVYSRSGVRSATASEILDSHSFTKVYNMLGGIQAWQLSGYPVWIATVHNIDTTFNYDTIQAAIDAPQTLDGHTITVEAGTYYEHVVVKKSLSLLGENRGITIIDGGGTEDENVVLMSMNNTVISGFTIRGSGCGCAGYSGIRLQGSHNSNITDNIITDNGYGIQIRYSNSCTISGNIVTTNDGAGIELYSSHRNIIINNDISENLWGIKIGSSSDNIFYHNSIVDNIFQKSVIGVFSNTWDDDYPSGGNYWSDYTGIDVKRGPDQDLIGSDGIGDTSYTIDENNQDRYPLMKPYGGPHDIGITNVTTSKTIVRQGYSLNVTVKTINYGINTETFNVTLYANEIIIQTKTITLTNRSSTTITLTWNTTGFAKGKYIVSAKADQVSGEIDMTDNTLIDGLVKIIVQAHDVAVTDVMPYKTVVGKGYTVSISVTTENWGNYTETFNVTAYYDPGNATSIPIETQAVTLVSGNSTTLTFNWNTTGVAKDNYTITAIADTVLGETDTTDNTHTNGWIIVAMIGDITGPDDIPDGKVDIRDISLTAKAFGAILVTAPTSPKYGEYWHGIPCNMCPHSPNCDLTGPTTGVADGKIDIRDIALVAIHFGEIDP